MTCKCLRRAHQITHNPSIGGGCQPLATSTEVAEEWTSIVLRENKHNFCFLMIEFQLVYIHPMTCISDTVLYAQPCNINVTIRRYVELSIISIEMINETMTSYYLSKWCSVQ